MLLLLRQLLGGVPRPPALTEQPTGGLTSIGQPFRWVPFAPVAPKRPRKKRQTEVLFLG